MDVHTLLTHLGHGCPSLTSVLVAADLNCLLAINPDQYLLSNLSSAVNSSLLWWVSFWLFTRLGSLYGQPVVSTMGLLHYHTQEANCYHGIGP